MATEFGTRQPVLRNPPLTLAIAQMRFPRLLGLAESDVRPIQRALVERYPQPSVGRAAEIVLTPSGVAPGAESEPVFQFRTDSQRWTVTLTPGSLSLETTEYVDFPDFGSRWSEILAAVAGELGISRQDRIGLRYVNELSCAARPEPDEIRRLVREELVGVVGAHPRTQRLNSSMQELRFAQESGVCTLRHGLVVKTPEEVAYVLDLDFYDDKPSSFEREAQIQQLAGFNHGAYELFRWSIPDELFTTFDPEEKSDE